MQGTQKRGRGRGRVRGRPRTTKATTSSDLRYSNVTSTGTSTSTATPRERNAEQSVTTSKTKRKSTSPYISMPPPPPADDDQSNESGMDDQHYMGSTTNPTEENVHSLSNGSRPFQLSSDVVGIQQTRVSSNPEHTNTDSSTHDVNDDTIAYETDDNADIIEDHNPHTEQENSPVYNDESDHAQSEEEDNNEQEQEQQQQQQQQQQQRKQTRAYTKPYPSTYRKRSNSITRQLRARRTDWPSSYTKLSDPIPEPPSKSQWHVSYQKAKHFCGRGIVWTLLILILLGAWDTIQDLTTTNSPNSFGSNSYMDNGRSSEGTLRHILDRTVVSMTPHVTVGTKKVERESHPEEGQQQQEDQLKVLFEQTWFATVYPNVRDMQDHIVHQMRTVQRNNINATRLDLYVARREYECHLWRSDARSVQYAYALVEEYCTQQFRYAQEYCPVEWEIAFPSYGTVANE